MFTTPVLRLKTTQLLSLLRVPRFPTLQEAEALAERHADRLQIRFGPVATPCAFYCESTHRIVLFYPTSYARSSRTEYTMPTLIG